MLSQVSQNKTMANRQRYEITRFYKISGFFLLSLSRIYLQYSTMKMQMSFLTGFIIVKRFPSGLLACKFFVGFRQQLVVILTSVLT